MNKEWHEEHKLAKNATPMERIAWHEAHQKYCACRPTPPSVKKFIPPNASADQA